MIDRSLPICDMTTADPEDDRPLEQLIAAIAEIAPDMGIEVCDVAYDAAHETYFAHLYDPDLGGFMVDLPISYDDLVVAIEETYYVANRG
jgi:hypothetical protein